MNSAENSQPGRVCENDSHMPRNRGDNKNEASFLKEPTDVLGRDSLKVVIPGGVRKTKTQATNSYMSLLILTYLIPALINIRITKYF